LEEGELVQVEELVGDEGADGRSEDGDEDGRERGAAGVVEDQSSNDNVLGGYQGGFAVGAEGEAIAEVVGEGDDVGGSLEKVGEDADAGGRLAVEQLEDLWDLDDGGGADNAEAEGLGDGKLEALLVGDGELAHEGGVAAGAEEGYGKLIDGARKVRSDGLEDGPQGFLEGFHDCCW